MKARNVNGDGKSLAFNEWKFQIILFTAQTSCVNFKNFSVLPRGDESSVYFSDGDEILGYFSHRRRIFGQFFQWGGVPPGL